MPVFLGMLADMKKNIRTPMIAAKFHNAICDIVVKTVQGLSARSGIKTIALSGGVFQNKYLASGVIKRLGQRGFSVFTNRRLPVNDLNIAWGQYHVSGCAGKN